MSEERPSDHGGHEGGERDRRRAHRTGGRYGEHGLYGEYRSHGPALTRETPGRPGDPGSGGPDGVPPRHPDPGVPRDWHGPSFAWTEDPLPQVTPGASRRGSRTLAGVLAAAFVLTAGTGGAAVAEVAAPPRANPAQSVPTAPGAKKAFELTKARMEPLLQQHAQALQQGNKKEFLALFRDKKKLMRNARQRFDGLTKLPLRKVSFNARRIPGSATDKFGKGVRATVDVAFAYKLKGADRRPVTEWYRWDVRQQPGKDWQVTRVRPGRGPDGERALSNHPAPWDMYADLTVVRRPHVIVLAGGEDAATARRYADVFERAAKYNLRVWKRTGPDSFPTVPGFVVTLESSRKRFARMYAGPGSVQSWVAGYNLPLLRHLSDPSKQERSRAPFGGARIMLDPTTAYFTRQGGRWAPELIRHEMAHALVAPGKSADVASLGRPASPFALWVVEGFAEYMGLRGKPVSTGTGYDAVRAYVARGRFDGTLPSNSQLRSDSLEVSASYALGGMALRYIAEHHGKDTMFRLVTEHYQEPQRLEKQVRKATGLSMAEFERRYARYVRNAVG